MLEEVQAALKAVEREVLEVNIKSLTVTASMNSSASKLAGAIDQTVFEAHAALSEVSATARIDLDAVRALQELNKTGAQCLATLYFQPQPSIENDDQRCKLVREVDQFYNDAAEQIMLISASVVGPDASTVNCSSTLLRLLAELLQTLHQLDVLRSFTYQKMYPQTAFMVPCTPPIQQRPHLRRLLLSGRSRPFFRRQPDSGVLLGTLEEDDDQQVDMQPDKAESNADEPSRTQLPEADGSSLELAEQAEVDDNTVAPSPSKKKRGLWRLLVRHKEEVPGNAAPKEGGSPLIKAGQPEVALEVGTEQLKDQDEIVPAPPPTRHESVLANLPASPSLPAKADVAVLGSPMSRDPASTLPVEQAPAHDEWQQFLAEPWTAVQLVCSRLQAVPYHPVFLAHLANWLLQMIVGKDGNQPLLAGDLDTVVCALPVVLYLLHPETDEGVERKLSSHLGPKRLLKCLKALRQHPVVPLIADIPHCVTTLLQASPALAAQGDLRGKEWQIVSTQELDGRPLAAAERLYDIASQAIAARSVHDTLVEALIAFALEVEEEGSQGGSKDPQLAAKALELSLTGTACIALWKQQLLRWQAWKAGRPSYGVQASEAADPRCASQQEMEAVVEVASLLKGVSSMLAYWCSWLQPLVHCAMFAHIQQFLQLEIPSWLKPSVPSKVQEVLLHVRTVLGDWPEGEPPLIKQPSKSRGFVAALKTSLRGKQDAVAVPALDIDAGTRNYLLAGATKAAISSLRAAVEGLIPAVQQTSLGTHMPFLMRAIPPSQMQLHQLIQALEQILRDAGNSTRGPFNGSSLSTNKQRELAAFDAMLQQWIPALDLPNAIAEAANLGHLILHECTNDTAMEGSLAVQLGAAVLKSPAGGPMESCLQSLQLYNDAALLAERLHTTHWLAKLTSQANACLNLLLSQLAGEAFRTYKACAAAALTEPTAADQCAQLPPLATHRHFANVLHMHSMPLLEQSVDVASHLAQRLNSTLRENAVLLVKRYQGAHASSLCELEALMAALRGCHELLSRDACLDPWHLIWAAGDGRPSFTEYRSNIVGHTVQDVTQSLLSTYTFCEATQRFVPGPKTGDLASLESHAEDAMLWGPCGSQSTVLGRWAAAHMNFFGACHLKALLHLNGPAAIALLAQTLEDHIIQLLQTQISPGMTEARERMQKAVALSISVRINNANTGYLAFQQILTKALGGEFQRELLSRQLTELGNAFALLCMLDDMLSAEQNTAFLLAAPLLGIGTISGSRLSQQVDGDARAVGPLQQAYDRLTGTGNEQQVQPSAPPGPAASPAATLIQEAIKAGWKGTAHGSLLPGSFQRIKQALASLSLSWEEPQAQAHHVASAALFDLCTPRKSRSRVKPPAERLSELWPNSGETSLTPRARKQRGYQANPAEWDQRGDSPALGALFLVGLLGQSAAFSLADHSLAILQAAAYESPAEMGPDVSAFVAHAHRLDRLAVAAFAKVAAALPSPVPPGILVTGQPGKKPRKVAADPPPFAAPFVDSNSFQPVQSREEDSPKSDTDDMHTMDAVMLTGITTPTDTEQWPNARVELPPSAWQTSSINPDQDLTGAVGWQQHQEIYDRKASREYGEHVSYSGYGQGTLETYQEFDYGPPPQDQALDRGAVEELPYRPTMDVSISPRGRAIWNQPLRSSLSSWESCHDQDPAVTAQLNRAATLMTVQHAGHVWPARPQMQAADSSLALCVHQARSQTHQPELLSDPAAVYKAEALADTTDMAQRKLAAEHKLQHKPKPPAEDQVTYESELAAEHEIRCNSEMMISYELEQVAEPEVTPDSAQPAQNAVMYEAAQPAEQAIVVEAEPLAEYTIASKGQQAAEQAAAQQPLQGAAPVLEAQADKQETMAAQEEAEQLQASFLAEKSPQKPAASAESTISEQALAVQHPAGDLVASAAQDSLATEKVSKAPVDDNQTIGSRPAVHPDKEEVFKANKSQQCSGGVREAETLFAPVEEAPNSIVQAVANLHVDADRAASPDLEPTDFRTKPASIKSSSTENAAQSSGSPAIADPMARTGVAPEQTAEARPMPELRVDSNSFLLLGAMDSEAVVEEAIQKAASPDQPMIARSPTRKQAKNAKKKAGKTPKKCKASRQGSAAEDAGTTAAQEPKGNISSPCDLTEAGAGEASEECNTEDSAVASIRLATTVIIEETPIAAVTGCATEEIMQLLQDCVQRTVCSLSSAQLGEGQDPEAAAVATGSLIQVCSERGLHSSESGLGALDRSAALEEARPNTASMATATPVDTAPSTLAHPLAVKPEMSSRYQPADGPSMSLADVHQSGPASTATAAQRQTSNNLCDLLSLPDSAAEVPAGETARKQQVQEAIVLAEGRAQNTQLTPDAIDTPGSLRKPSQLSVNLPQGAAFAGKEEINLTPRKTAGAPKDAPQTPFSWAAQIGEGLFGRLPRGMRRSADSTGQNSPGKGFSLESLF